MKNHNLTFGIAHLFLAVILLVCLIGIVATKGSVIFGAISFVALIWNAMQSGEHFGSYASSRNG